MRIFHITKNKFLLLACSMGILAIGILFFLGGAFTPKETLSDPFCIENSDAARRALIESYHIRISPLAPAVEHYTVPTTFSETEEQYEGLQNEMGLSLCEYKGKTLIKYTYEMINHPDSYSTPVSVHLFMLGNRVVAADVCNPDSETGFLYSLEYFRP